VSVVFSAFRLNKNVFWPFAEAARARYLEAHFMARIISEFGPRMSAEKKLDFALKLADRSNMRLQDQLCSELRIFDEGDTVIVSANELGQMLEAELAGEWGATSGWAAELEPISVDTRDESRFDVNEKLMPTVDWIDSQMRAGRYLQFTLCSTDDWWAQLMAVPLPETPDTEPGKAFDDELARKLAEQA
jgi:hypothetical protein